MFYPSLEIRWFIPGELDEEGEVALRFLAIPFPLDPSETSDPAGGCVLPTPEWPDGWREDRYLPIADREDVGVKLRREVGTAPARVEFKGRLDDVGLVDFGAGLRGRVERWAKWAARADDVPADLRRLVEAEGPATRVSVRKRRLQRVLRLAEDGAAYEILDPARDVDRGVGVEITRLEVGAASWWSLGFEAFPDVRPDELEPIVRRVVAGVAPKVLAGATSCGYPAWLLGRRGAV